MARISRNRVPRTGPALLFEKHDHIRAVFAVHDRIRSSSKLQNLNRLFQVLCSDTFFD